MVESPLNNPSHPIWPLARTVVVTLGVTVSLWLNASSFDATELKAIAEILLIVTGAEGLKRLVVKRPETPATPGS